jgi:DNA-binding winged helix-turn-helix (wHTH) protein
MHAFIGRLARPEPGFDVNHPAQSPVTDKAFFVPPTKASLGPFRLLPTQLLLLEGEKPVPLGRRALEMLTALLERRGELVSRQDSMARVWPDFVVKPANLKVHMSALRNGRDGHWFIVNVPGLAAT